MNRDGYMTVYLALITGVLLSLILAVIEGARAGTIRMHIECCADMALDSALAQYHREMLEQYELFFIDTSYGSADPSYHRTEAQIRSYMEQNLHPQDTFSIPFASDLTGLSVRGVQLLRAGIASDEGGAVLKYHIAEYMKDTSGISLAESILSCGRQLNPWRGRNMEAEWDQAEAALKEEIIHRKQLSDENWDGSIPETPSDAVRSTRGEPILGAAAQGIELSSASIPAASRASVRPLNRGTGLADGREPANGLLNDGLLYTYILDRCGYLGSAKENSALSYEVEYILQQGTADRENLEKTAREILLIREAANLACLTGSGLRSQAAQAASLLASVLLMPEIQPAAEAVILFAWAYAESIKDIRILFQGGKIPLVKTEASWNTPFSRLLTYRSHMDDYRPSETGWSYREYLGALLFCRGADRAIAGLMDVMEQDIRKTAGNESFRIDGLIDGMEAEISVVSRFGGDYSIRRIYAFE